MNNNEQIELGLACIRNARLTGLVALAATASTVVGLATGMSLVTRGSFSTSRARLSTVVHGCRRYVRCTHEDAANS